MKNFSAWGLLLSLCAPVLAADVWVEDLRLRTESSWRRGAPAQEDEDRVVLLSWPVSDSVGLQLVIPRDPPLLKSDDESFYRQLGRKWGALYGKAASVGWIETGKAPDGRRWLACRRPASSGEGVVFHLATVHEGRAYSLLLFAPPATDTLPKAALDLLAAADFKQPAITWRQGRSLALYPKGEALEALAQVVAEGLGEAGMLSGYGVKGTPPGAGEPRLGWFLDGFLWTRDKGRDERSSFEVRGELSAAAPSDLATGRLRVTLAQQAAQGPLRATVSAHDYCGEPGPWREAVSNLERGARAPLERLKREHGCPPQTDDAALGGVDAGAGQTVTREFSPRAPASRRAVAHWLEVELAPADKPRVGDALLERLALYFIYEPVR